LACLGHNWARQTKIFTSMNNKQNKQQKNKKKSKSSWLPSKIERPPVNHNLLSIKNTYGASVVTGGASGNFGVVNPQLSDLGNYSNYVNIFDQFRIMAVRVQFWPKERATTVSNPGVPFGTIIDFDGYNATNSFALFRAYDTFQQVDSSVSVSRTFQPRISLLSVIAATSSVSASQSQQWLDLATAGSLPHYGLAWIVAPTVPATEVLYDVDVTLWVQLRGVR
jgi:hypothetical protein